MESCIGKKQLDNKEIIKFKTTFYLVVLNIVSSSSSTKSLKKGHDEQRCKKGYKKNYYYYEDTCVYLQLKFAMLVCIELYVLNC